MIAQCSLWELWGLWASVQQRITKFITGKNCSSHPLLLLPIYRRWRRWIYWNIYCHKNEEKENDFSTKFLVRCWKVSPRANSKRIHVVDFERIAVSCRTFDEMKFYDVCHHKRSFASSSSNLDNGYFFFFFRTILLNVRVHHETHMNLYIRPHERLRKLHVSIFMFDFLILCAVLLNVARACVHACAV